MSDHERIELWRDLRLAFHRRMLKSHGEAPMAPGAEIERNIRRDVAGRQRRLALLRQRAAQA